MNAKERILEFISDINIGQAAFEKKAGISNGYINNIKGSIGSKIINKISEAYPELNIDWLLTGEGSMLKGTPPNNNTNPLNEDTMTIGLLTKLLYDSQARVKELEKEMSALRGENSMLKSGTEKKESIAG